MSKKNLLRNGIVVSALGLAGFACHRELPQGCELAEGHPACVAAASSDTGPPSDTAEDADVDADATPQCDGGPRKCIGNKLQRCVGPEEWEVEQCVLGCKDDDCVVVTDLVGALGGQHFCVSLSDGTVRCWGSNTEGQIGGSAAELWKPTEVSGVTNVKKVSIGGVGSVALLNDGTLRWWGWVPSSPSPASKQPPLAVPGLANVKDVAFGGSHCCALVEDGKLRCWGEGDFGELGDGASMARYPPALASVALADASSLVLASQVSFALVGSDVHAWGGNNFGQLGQGSVTIPFTTPQSTVGYARQVSSNGASTCWLLLDGTIKCAGQNNWGQLGDGTKSDASKPVTVASLAKARQVAGPSGHTCALLETGAVKCWGWNGAGQLGDGTTAESLSPVTVPASALGAPAKLAVVGETTCALTGRASVKCWGSNYRGLLGANLDPSSAPRRLTPTDVVW